MHKASARTCTNKEQPPGIAVLQSPEIHVSPRGRTGGSPGIAVGGGNVQPRGTQQRPQEANAQHRQAVPELRNITKTTIFVISFEILHMNEYLFGLVIGKGKGRRQGAMELSIYLEGDS